MLLKSIKYSEFEGESQEWALDELLLGVRNLIVGKNAVGKTRTLNVIDGLSLMLEGARGIANVGAYEAVFVDGDQQMRYILKFANSMVVNEKFLINDEVKLERGVGGEGTIWSNEIGGGSRQRFQSPPQQLAVFARRDEIQHPFLESLYQWGSSVRHYYFGSAFGKDNLAIFQEGAPKPSERDHNAAIALFKMGEKTFGDPFKNAVIQDMEALGYFIEDIHVGPPVSLSIIGTNQVVTLNVKERDLPGITDQASISQGMFRALAVLIHVNFCHFKKAPACILIDDIGEGLDFDRSCRLIDALRSKTDGTQIQLVLTTNDRFVMNRIPLEEWSVLQRVKGRVAARNHENSREIFESFRFTGLSNFSFLEMDVLGEADASVKH